MNYIETILNKYISMYNIKLLNKPLENIITLSEFRIHESYYAYIDLLSADNCSKLYWVNEEDLFLRFDIEGADQKKYIIEWHHDKHEFLKLKNDFQLKYIFSTYDIDIVLKSFIIYSKCSKEYMIEKYYLK